MGCSPWGREESDANERLPFHFSLSCIGEGNGNPLQCSCLENPRDGGAWWAAVCGVAQNRTRLKRLSMHTHKAVLYWQLNKPSEVRISLAAAAKSCQSCLTLCDPIDGSPPDIEHTKPIIVSLLFHLAIYFKHISILLFFIILFFIDI